MEYIGIKPSTEEDFDQVVKLAGGARISEEGSADYRLNEANIELKLVSEEGFEKIERQRKLADLFRETQPLRPLVLVNPDHFNTSDSRKYYRIVEGPIKSVCKKASKQLQTTSARYSPTPVRVLIILNIGYTLLSPDEFKDVCFKCVLNDTSGIDWLLCGGIYFYSDKFDNYVIEPFEDIPINLGRCSFPSRNSLVEAWGQLAGKLMTDAIRNPIPISDARMPVIDLVFELEGVHYVKPTPEMPQSTFWPGGVGPRENTSGIDNCPPVARTFPLLSENEWRRFKKAMPSSIRLQDSHPNWLKSCPDDVRQFAEPLKPLVFVEVKFEDFARWIRKQKAHWQFSDIGNFSSKVFHQCAL